ncbi:MAG TPA: hypothetical protein VFN33_03055 [Gaiellaceae bacterium]|nr:hypothetical protein [Gaiellaceae bacterium]
MRSKFLWAALALVAVLGITTAASATTRGLITGKQIAPHSINSKHLVNHTIQKHDLSNKLIRSLHGAKGARGPAGPQGPTGPQGANGAIGPQGPSGIVSTANSGGYENCYPNPTDWPGFCGPPDTVKFDAKTAVLVTGTLMIASTDGDPAGGNLGICAAYDTANLFPVALIGAGTAGPAGSYIGQTVSGVVGGLQGTAYVGLCTWKESTNTEHGDYWTSIVVAETQSGVTYLTP